MLKSRVLIKLGADQNCIKEGLVLIKYFEKVTERLYGASGKKLDIIVKEKFNRV